MSLLESWTSSPNQLTTKSLEQIIAWAGNGTLGDNSSTSREFRKYLSEVPSDYLERYAQECLAPHRYRYKGYALQDIVNTIGARLGYQVEYGRYIGRKNGIGFDGLWKTPDGRAIIVEVRTTDVYSLDLEKIGAYRKRLSEEGRVEQDKTSMVIVVGRQDTGTLEAQVRGSKYSHEMRIISVDALIRLMHLKENLEEPEVLPKIRSILTPQPFTRLDNIVDLVFSTAEEARETAEEDEPLEERPSNGGRRPEVEFREACIRKAEQELGKRLVKRSRSVYASSDGQVVVVCSISRKHAGDGATANRYVFRFLRHQQDEIAGAEQGYAAFGCGRAGSVVLASIVEVKEWLELLYPDGETREGWTITFEEVRGKLHLKTSQGPKAISALLLK